MMGAHVAPDGRRYVIGMRQLVIEAVEDLRAEGVSRFTSATVIKRASMRLPDNGRGPAEIARMAKAIENLVTEGRLHRVDTQRMPGIKRPVSVYEWRELCPLAGAELQAAIQGWMPGRD